MYAAGYRNYGEAYDLVASLGVRRRPVRAAGMRRPLPDGLRREGAGHGRRLAADLPGRAVRITPDLEADCPDAVWIIGRVLNYADGVCEIFVPIRRLAVTSMPVFPDRIKVVLIGERLGY